MNKILYPVVALLILALCGWHAGRSNQIDKAYWLIGAWQMKTPNGDIYESWKKINQSELSGQSYMLKDNDTITFETIKLVQKGDSLFYIPTVKRLNQGLPVSFTMKSISDTELIFENSAHDFLNSFLTIVSDKIL